MVDQDHLSVYEFGRQLLDTNDLDPVYVVLWEAKLAPADLRRWLLAYWCFYHVGTASVIACSETGYWGRMTAAAGSKKWPRSSERRHFRGKQAKKSIAYLAKRDIHDLFAPLEKGPYTASQIMESVKEWVGFGPWIAFKVADMVERLGIARVDFTGSEMMLFDSPREGAELLMKLEKKSGLPHPEVWAVNRILSELNTKVAHKHRHGARYLAPPRRERLLNEQEAETILCKWKSYMNGHYHIGEDIQAVKKGLLLGDFAKNDLCQRLHAAGKRGGLW